MSRVVCARLLDAAGSVTKRAGERAKNTAIEARTSTQAGRQSRVDEGFLGADCESLICAGAGVHCSPVMTTRTRLGPARIVRLAHVTSKRHPLSSGTQDLEVFQAFEANQSGAWPDHIATSVAVHPLGRAVICFVKRSALYSVRL